MSTAVTTEGLATLSNRKAHLVGWRVWALLGLVLVLAGCGGGSGGTSVAAAVNGNNIPMEQYNSELNSLRVQERDAIGYDVCLIKQLASACGIIKQRSLNILIDNELIREYAHKHGLSVSQDESARQWTQVFKVHFHNSTAVEAAFLKHQQISESDIRRSLMADLLQQKVEFDVTQSLSRFSKAVRVGKVVAVGKSELAQVRSLIRSGVGFAGIANYLRHTSRSSLGCASTTVVCGDLGWTPYAFIPPNRRALITARDGSILGPYREQQDWQFLKAEAHSSHYFLTSKQLFTRRQQLFLQWLQRQQKRARITRYVAV